MFRGDQMVNLDDTPLSGPTPWEIMYLNDQNSKNARQILPKARTQGLGKFNSGYELQIRKVPPNKAAPTLDQIGLWIMKNKPIQPNDEFIVFKILYKIVWGIGEYGKRIQRLSWENDT